MNANYLVRESLYRAYLEFRKEFGSDGPSKAQLDEWIDREIRWNDDFSKRGTPHLFTPSKGGE